MPSNLNQVMTKQTKERMSDLSGLANYEAAGLGGLDNFDDLNGQMNLITLKD
jgi:hypothetical protein